LFQVEREIQKQIHSKRESQTKILVVPVELYRKSDGSTPQKERIEKGFELTVPATIVKKEHSTFFICSIHHTRIVSNY